MATELREHDLNVPLILTIGVASVFWLAVIVLFARAWVFYQQNELWEQNVARVEDRTLMRYIDSEQQNLDTHQWADTEKRTVTIPLDQAIDAYLEEAKKTRTARADSPE